MNVSVRIWPAVSLAFIGFILSILVAGCGHGPAGKADTQVGADQKKSDQELIQAQGFCPVSKEKLGSMGQPVKIAVKGQPIFLCCASCEDDAKADSEKTLATVEELKRKNKQ